MGYITGLTRDKHEWTPQFVKAIDEGLCIGCGRCFKVCSHDVIGPVEVDEDDSAKMYMRVTTPGRCIGCQACGRTCAKKAFSFEPVLL